MKLNLIFLNILLYCSCANIVSPTGGDKDTKPPNCIDLNQNIEINNNKDSKIILVFDERIQEHSFIDNFYISPLINNVSHKIKGNVWEIIIKDTIHPYMIYYVNQANCIKDITEGNIMTNGNSLIYSFNQSDTLVTRHNLHVNLRSSLNNELEKNHWILLYNSDIPDSLIFKTDPNYVCKTDENGYFLFNNLIDGRYKAVSLSGTDYIYHENETISFYEELVVTGIDTIINLLTFNPLDKIDSTEIVKDTTITEGGNLTLKSDFRGNIIVQLMKENKVIIQESFKNTTNFTLKNIKTGEYNVRAFSDTNDNGYWDTGNFTEKNQPEKTYHFKEKITIRSNWDLELEWFIEE